ncbi:MAG: MFS transporter [Steroidobacteraceae bacterium]|jgi:DHA2 family multidrug resistance protein-like MFS transporter|nr:MFS transporter [Steroidobacteraceae bacterium]
MDSPGREAPDTPPRATRREWTGLAVIALPCLVYSMDLTVLNLAIPAISAELKPSSAQLLWMIDIYGFLVAGLLITMGTLGDRIGRRRLLLAGAAAFGAASWVAAFSGSAPMLIAMRALLGVAGATLAPSTLSLIRNMFHDPQQRQFAIGVWIASFSLGGAIGPLVGGLLLEYFHWGSVFLVAVPVMALLLLLGPRLLPEYRDPQAGVVDLTSVLLSIVAVLAVIYGVKHVAEHGLQAPSAVAIGGGLLVGGAFLHRQSRLSYPLLDLGLFRQPRFAAAVSAYGLSSLAMFGIYIFVTQFLQLVLGLSPLMAGLATLPWAIGFLAGSLGTSRLTRRWLQERIIVGGLALAAVAFGLMLWVDATPAGLAILVASTVLMSLAMAPVFTVGNEIIITAAPPERAGAASAISETAAEFSGALGIAVLGSLGIALYRNVLRDALPAGLDASASAQALATLGGALAVGESLEGPPGRALQQAARDAFMHSLRLAAIVGLVTVSLSAALAARMLAGARR